MLIKLIYILQYLFIKRTHLMQQPFFDNQHNQTNNNLYPNPYNSNDYKPPSHEVNNPYNYPNNINQLPYPNPNINYVPNSNPLYNHPNPINNSNLPNPNPCPPPYGNLQPNPYNENYDFADYTNRLKTKKNSIHWQALIATLILAGGLTAACLLYFNTNVQLGLGGFIGACCGSYVLYLIVGCSCNKLIEYVKNVDKGQNFQTYYNRVREMVGRFVFHAQCYHYQIRHHTRTHRDGNGKTRIQHYTSREKVVTHSSTQYLGPYQTKDQSGQIQHIRANTSIVFIHFFVKYRFFDPLSSGNFEKAYLAFKMRNTRDAHQDFSLKYEVPGLVERKSFYVGNLGCDFNGWFYFFTAIGLIWPYSMWVQSKITRFDVETMKVLKV